MATTFFPRCNHREVIRVYDKKRKKNYSKILKILSQVSLIIVTFYSKILFVVAFLNICCDIFVRMTCLKLVLNI